MYLQVIGILISVHYATSAEITLKNVSYRRIIYGKSANNFILRSEISPSKLVCIGLCETEKGSLTTAFSPSTGRCTCHAALPQDMTLTDSRGTSLYVIECMMSPGYVYDNEAYFCYKVHRVKVEWEEAQDVCHSEGGELAKVDTAAKRSIVNRIVTDDGSTAYFLGATDSDKDGEWRWVSDNSLVEGFNKQGSAECLELEEVLIYDDTGCSDQDQRYICEVLLP